jgi:hypothetical protein
VSWWERTRGWLARHWPARARNGRPAVDAALLEMREQDIAARLRALDAEAEVFRRG